MGFGCLCTALMLIGAYIYVEHSYREYNVPSCVVPTCFASHHHAHTIHIHHSCTSCTPPTPPPYHHLKQQHLGDSPATVTASTSEACAAMCEVRGAPLDLVTTAGRAADVYIIAKDAKGIQKSLGGDVFHVTWQHMGSGEGQVTNGMVLFCGCWWWWVLLWCGCWCECMKALHENTYMRPCMIP